VLYRLTVYFGVGLGYLFAALSGAGTAIAFASFSAKPSSVASIGAILGLAGLGFLLYRFRGSLFFNVKAGQLALLSQQARNIKLPEGKAQIDFAKQTAAARFTPASFLALSQSMGQVLYELPLKYLPLLANAGDDPTGKAKRAIAGEMSRSCVQPMLATMFSSDAGAWALATAPLAFQARHLPTLLKYRLYTVAFEYIGLIAFFPLMLYSVNAGAALLPVDIGAWRYVFALIFSWSLKEAFLTPIATAAMANLYFNRIDAERNKLAATLDELAAWSSAFREVQAKSD
jgi:hypothetical protein